MYFAVWAPGARRVSVVGDFILEWDVISDAQNGELDIFELFIPGLSCGQFYKFEIKNVQGDIIQMVDPYAVMNEERKTARQECLILGDFAGRIRDGFPNDIMEMFLRHRCLCVKYGLVN